jgi:hypothetical protein
MENIFKLLSFLEKLYNFKKNYIILLYNMTYNIDIINLGITVILEKII